MHAYWFHAYMYGIVEQWFCKTQVLLRTLCIIGMYGPGGMGPGPRGMMMPRPGVPMMGMGRGGFPPMAGPPMDMYYYNPYMGEGVGFYGENTVGLCMCIRCETVSYWVGLSCKG